MSGGIFLVQSDDSLVRMDESPYDSEDRLQALLAKYPDLLAGDQLRPTEPRRWLLIIREASIPDADGAAGRWSVDHLFLDQDGIPTLVEVKRSTDTRIRREVVGQMLDYAANALLYWPVATIQSLFQAHCDEEHQDPEVVLADFLGADGNPEDYWLRVRTNLEARKIRLLFVADTIPVELQRVIEFLNDQLSQSEVLGIEVRQYLGESLSTLVPRVIGLKARKSVSAPAGPSETALRYQRFFEAAITELKTRSLGISLPSAPTRNWYCFSTGRSGFQFCWTVVPRERVRVDLYLSDPEAKDFFAALLEQREAIEAELGPIQWERLDQKKASRVAVYHPYPATELDELREAGGYHRDASSTMLQKANPISSEAAVGFSMLAASQVPVLPAAMQPRHERAAGEWQSEWDALPIVATAAAGAMANSLDCARGLRVDPDRMAANLDLDGGMIMAEAAMMALAPTLGRGPAHDVVYAACMLAREDGRTLIDALALTLEPALVAQLPPLAELLEPASYLGEAVAIADRSVAAWRDRAAVVAAPGGSPG